MGAAGVLAGATIAEAQTSDHRFVVDEVTVESAAIDPAHDGVRVAQLSDIHVGMFTPDSRIIGAIRELNARKPDLVVLTGDFVTTKRDPLSRLTDLLRDVSLPAVAVLGNHDHWSGAQKVGRAIEGASISLLRNQHTTLRVRGAPFHVVGVDDARTKNDDPQRAFGGVPSGSRFVLTHTPSGADRLPEDQDFLCVSGHTHGGHVVVPGVTRWWLRRIGQPYARGMYQVRGNQLYVNRGLGMNGPVPRVGSPPELTVFTLRSAEVLLAG